MEHLPPTLSERPTMRYRPEPSVVPANDSDPPLPPGRKVGPILALIGAVAFGVTIAMVVAPKLAVVVAPEAEEASAPSPAGAPPPVDPEELDEVSARAGQALATEVATRVEGDGENDGAGLDGIDEPQTPEASSPVVEPTTISARHGAVARSRSRARSGRTLLRTASNPRAIDAPEVGDHAIGRAARRSRRQAGELEASAVRRVIEQHQTRMRHCYQRAVRHSGQARDARVTVTIDVDPDGHVNAARVSGPDFGGLSHCLWRVAVRWHFPESRDGGRVPVPVAFSARDR